MVPSPAGWEVLRTGYTRHVREGAGPRNRQTSETRPGRTGRRRCPRPEGAGRFRKGDSPAGRPSPVPTAPGPGSPRGGCGEPGALEGTPGPAPHALPRREVHGSGPPGGLRKVWGHVPTNPRGDEVLHLLPKRREHLKAPPLSPQPVGPGPARPRPAPGARPPLGAGRRDATAQRRPHSPTRTRARPPTSVAGTRSSGWSGTAARGRGWGRTTSDLRALTSPEAGAASVSREPALP